MTGSHPDPNLYPAAMTSDAHWLWDADSGDPIGPATPEQIAASDESDARGQHGVIEIDENGYVVAEGEQVVGPTRRAYTQ